MIDRIFSTVCNKSGSERKLEIISNNIANALTPGFKALRPVLSSTAVGNADETGGFEQTYVNLYGSYVHFSDAPLVQTGNSFDLAVEGNGFFAVSTPTGTMYTRNGQFTLNGQKKLVTMDGSPVQGQDGAEITIDGKDVKIENDGSVFVDGARVGGVKVVDFGNKKALMNVGKSLFANAVPSNAETAPDHFAVKQGAYEASNVDVMQEMVELMNTLRAYETYTKVDQMSGDTLEKLIEMGKP